MSEQQLSPEQAQEMQEKIKNMSPEELKEFQKKQCLFCHIIAGKIPAKKVFEDDTCIAILDINPANPGHILLLPKEHYAIMPQIPEDEVGHLFTMTKRLSNALLRGIEAKGTNILVANGVEAGQKAQHFMIHVIPRFEKDGVEFTLPQKEHKEEELDQLEESIMEALGQKKREAQQGKAHPLNLPGKIQEAHTAKEESKREPPLQKSEETLAAPASKQPPKEDTPAKEPKSETREPKGSPAPKKKRPKKKKTAKREEKDPQEDSKTDLDDIADLFTK